MFTRTLELQVSSYSLGRYDSISSHAYLSHTRTLPSALRTHDPKTDTWTLPTLSHRTHTSHIHAHLLILSTDATRRLPFRRTHTSHTRTFLSTDTTQRQTRGRWSRLSHAHTPLLHTRTFLSVDTTRRQTRGRWSRPSPPHVTPSASVSWATRSTPSGGTTGSSTSTTSSVMTRRATTGPRWAWVVSGWAEVVGVGCKQLGGWLGCG